MTNFILTLNRLGQILEMASLDTPGNRSLIARARGIAIEINRLLAIGHSLIDIDNLLTELHNVLEDLRNGLVAAAELIDDYYFIYNLIPIENKLEDFEKEVHEFLFGQILDEICEDYYNNNHALNAGADPDVDHDAGADPDVDHDAGADPDV